MRSSTSTRLIAAAAMAAATAGMCALGQPAAYAAAANGPGPRPATAAAQNGVINFSQGRDWYAVNPDGGGKHVVVPSGPDFDPTMAITSPVFSPDGTRAVFQDNSGLWACNADGTGAHRLTDPDKGLPPGTVADIFPGWLDDSTIVFVRNDGSGMYRINPDGTGLAKWQAPAGLTGTPKFGPNGLIGFTTADGGGFTTKVYSSAQGKVIATFAGVGQYDFSHDGTKIAYESGHGAHGAQQIFVAGVDGSNPVQITHIAGVAWAPLWSPDGTRIAFTDETWDAAADTAGPMNFVVIPATGGDETMLMANFNANYTSWQDGPVYTGKPYWPTPFGPLPAKPVIDRLGGADRVDTSAKVSGFNTADWGSGGMEGVARAAVLTRSDQFADALSGTALAVSKQGPLLLTDPSALNAEAAAELIRVLPKGATVYLLGGVNALSPAVEKAVQALGFKTSRVAGADRYATSVAIAQAVGPQPGSVAVATGNGFSDALTAGAGVQGNVGMRGPGTPNLGVGVVLLSDDGVLPQVTKDYLKDVDPTVSKVYGVGGQGVKALNTGMPQWSGKFTPLAGIDRYDTALKVASSSMFSRGVYVPGIATGRNWPDALSGGALSGRYGSPLLLADGGTLPAAELNWLKTTLPDSPAGPLPSGWKAGALPVYGGPAVVPDSVLKQVGDALYGVGNYDVAVNRHLALIPMQG